MSLSVIHLSDIHIEDSIDYIFQRMDALNAACVSSLPTNGTVVIAISGDIANKGKKPQYDLAKQMLNTLSDYIFEQKGSKVHIVCVPGNHDCDLSNKSSTRDALINSVKVTSIDQEYYKSVVEVQKEYQIFAESYGIDFSKVLPRVTIQVDDSSVLFLLANTAWMSVLNEKPGAIIVPSSLFEEVSPEKYGAVFYMYHHPISWLNPDNKRSFVDSVRQNADIVLVGHEHQRDSYDLSSSSFAVYCNHGEELQDRESDNSAFSVINFDKAFSTFETIDFKWNGVQYERKQQDKNTFHKNIAAKNRVYTPNEESLKYANDIGVGINHFAKDTVTLTDLFVWPDLSKSDFLNEKNGNQIIKNNAIEEINNNSLSIIVGSSSSGKTAIAKTLFLYEEPLDNCCLLLEGSDFISSDAMKIQEIIDNKYVEQYSQQHIEEFRQLPKDKRSIIIDNFDSIKNNKERRSAILDYLCGYFGRVTIFISAPLDITTLLKSKTLEGINHLVYYTIMPLGNRKRKDIISKWYHLNQLAFTDEEIELKIENAIKTINVFLGNGKGFVQADPFIIICALQNIDGINKSYSGSKYCFLYESLILNSFSNNGYDYDQNKGLIDIDFGILSELSFLMLKDKRSNFSLEQMEKVVFEIGQRQLISIPSDVFLQRILDAKLIHQDSCNGDLYRFRYPYIFYYFCGRYLAFHLDEQVVKETIGYMSTKLYNETYGNIVIFLCHFAHNSEVIDDILINAYDTLQNYPEFDFDKSNPIFVEIKDEVQALIPQRIASSENEISANKNTRLVRMDEAGINDGKMINCEDTIDDEITDEEKEKDLAAVVASFKTIEVLGEILQNYPMRIQGEQKIEIIDAIHKLGMRSVQAIIKTMRYYENDFVDLVFKKQRQKNKGITREFIYRKTHQLINLLISGTARGMIHDVAFALNSDHLLPAAKASLEKDQSVSSKLVLLDLKLNCLKKCNYPEIQDFRKQLVSNNEEFAIRIVDSIVAQYLNFNNCNHELRAKLCALCGYSQQNSLISSQRNLLN